MYNGVEGHINSTYIGGDIKASKSIKNILTEEEFRMQGVFVIRLLLQAM
jgi:hypothetical protein